MQFAAVIFDLDGTLVDSMPLHAEAWTEAFTVTGFSPPAVEAYLLEGAKSEEFARKMWRKYTGVDPEETMLETVVSRKKALEMTFETRFFPGALDLLGELAARDIRMAVVSGSKDVRRRLAPHPEFLSKFGAIVSGDDTADGKPHPAPFLKAFADLGVSPDAGLVVENAPLGIRGAIAAGAPCWAVLNNSPLTEEDLRLAGAERVLSDLAALSRALLS